MNYYPAMQKAVDANQTVILESLKATGCTFKQLHLACIHRAFADQISVTLAIKGLLTDRKIIKASQGDRDVFTLATKSDVVSIPIGALA